MMQADSNAYSAAILREKPTLRILGTSVTMHEEIRQQAQQDLNLNIEYIIDDGFTVQRTGTMFPQKYDIYDQWFHSIDCLWPARAIQPIDITKIKNWPIVEHAIQQGVLGTYDKHKGSVPIQRLFVQKDGSLSQDRSALISMLPVTYNTDSFLYVDHKTPKSLNNSEESWAWLLSPEYKGKVALQADAAIGAIDAALAVQASNLATFKDIGNLSIKEIDTLIKILMEYKAQGHFYGVWSTVSEAIQFITEGQVSIQSIWSPSITELDQTQLKYHVAKPKEGYRGWFGGLALSRLINPQNLDACYEFLNWSLSQAPARLLERKGVQTINTLYNSSTVSIEKLSSSQDSIDKIAIIPSTSIQPVAVWNSVMDEHNYLVRRWHEFLRSPPVNFLNF